MDKEDEPEKAEEAADEGEEADGPGGADFESAFGGVGWWRSFFEHTFIALAFWGTVANEERVYCLMRRFRRG